MGCPITKDKLECNMLALKLKRIEIRLARDREIEQYKKKTGEDLNRKAVPDYIDYDGTIQMKLKEDKAEGNNENNKNDLTCATIKRNSRHQAFSRSKSKSRSKNKIKNDPSTDNIINPIKMKNNGVESFDKKIKLKRYKTGKSIKRSPDIILERKSTMNPIRFNNKYNATNRDYYPMNSLIINGLIQNEHNQYLSGLRRNNIH